MLQPSPRILPVRLLFVFVERFSLEFLSDVFARISGKGRIVTASKSTVFKCPKVKLAGMELVFRLTTSSALLASASKGGGNLTSLNLAVWMSTNALR